jgi:hypothetical protein
MEGGGRRAQRQNYEIVCFKEKRRMKNLEKRDQSVKIYLCKLKYKELYQSSCS